MRRFQVLQHLDISELEKQVNAFAEDHFIVDITIRCYRYNHLWYAFILWEVTP